MEGTRHWLNELKLRASYGNVGQPERYRPLLGCDALQREALLAATLSAANL